MVEFPKSIKSTKCKTKTNTVIADTKHGTVKIPIKTPVTPPRKDEPRRKIG